MGLEHEIANLKLQLAQAHQQTLMYAAAHQELSNQYAQSVLQADAATRKVAVLEFELSTCKQKNNGLAAVAETLFKQTQSLLKESQSLVKDNKSKASGLWKLRTQLAQYEARKDMPEPEPALPASPGTPEPATPRRSLFRMWVGAPEAPAPESAAGKTVPGLQRSHSITEASTRSLPQLPDTLGLGQGQGVGLTRCLSSPLHFTDDSGSGGAGDEDSSSSSTQQGSGSTITVDPAPQSNESASESSTCWQRLVTHLHQHHHSISNPSVSLPQPPAAVLRIGNVVLTASQSSPLHFTAAPAAS
jgi:hypothetical protein